MLWRLTPFCLEAKRFLGRLLVIWNHKHGPKSSSLSGAARVRSCGAARRDVAHAPPVEQFCRWLQEQGDQVDESGRD
jgi:hypothetical protein